MASVHFPKATRDIYREITDRIVGAIDAGAGTFQMPWYRGGMTLSRPINAKTAHPYRGVNIVSLWAAAQAYGYGSAFWASYRQWQSVGAQVRKGEKASLVVFYKELDRDMTDEESGEVETKTFLVARASSVFNASQVDGWHEPDRPVVAKVDVLSNAEAFVRSAGARVSHEGDRAYYRPSTDQIQMPDRERFTGTGTSTATESYYAVLFHELTHWTAHESRLARDLSGRFGDQAYAMEELVAELGAAFLCADQGVTNSPRLDHAAYIRSWLEVLSRDKKAIVTAASKASQAAEFLAVLHDKATQQAALPGSASAPFLVTSHVTP